MRFLGRAGATAPAAEISLPETGRLGNCRKLTGPGASRRAFAALPDNRTPIRPELSRSGWRRTRAALQRQGGNTCYACGAVRPWDAKRHYPISHLVPPHLWPGGHNDPANLATLCWSCNASQGSMAYSDWIKLPTGRPALIRAGRATAGSPRSSYGGRSAVITRDYTRKP